MKNLTDKAIMIILVSFTLTVATMVGFYFETKTSVSKYRHGDLIHITHEHGVVRNTWDRDVRVELIKNQNLVTINESHLKPCECK